MKQKSLTTEMRMEEINCPRVTVPDGWNAARDLEEYQMDEVIEDGDDVVSLYPKALRKVFHASLELRQILDFAIEGFLPARPEALTMMDAGAKIDLLIDLIDHNAIGGPHDRLINDLHLCRKSLVFRDAILTKSLKQTVWLYELTGASDWLLTAAYGLLESLQIEMECDASWSPEPGETLDPEI